MDVSLALTNIQQATQEFQQQAGGDRRLGRKETTLFFPPTLGQGYMRGVHLREGLDLFIYECDFKQDLILDFRKLSPQHSLVNIAFCLAGYCTGTMPGIKNKLDVAARQTTFSTVPYAAGTTELLAGQQIKVIELAITPACMLTLIGDNLDRLPVNWRQNLKHATSAPSFLPTRTSPEVACILQSILQCPHQGNIQQLYLEGKALELIALYFAQLMAHPADGSQIAQLKRKDIDSLRQAQKILLQNIGEPPSLADLSQQVGMSERKLQQGFQTTSET
ncbi:MAG: hypothetical protein AAFN08_15335, partial [Cyanobacteria bacterium J06559_3]